MGRGPSKAIYNCTKSIDEEGPSMIDYCTKIIDGVGRAIHN